MYFVLKSLKLYLHYSALHVSYTIVSIIRSFSAAHAVSVPVWCLVRCVLQFCCVVTAVTIQQDWRTQRTKHHTVCNNNIIQETNPTKPQPKTKQHKTNIEVKKRFICATQIICSNYKMYIMTYL